MGSHFPEKSALVAVGICQRERMVEADASSFPFAENASSPRLRTALIRAMERVKGIEPSS
jgi:hypothetical protein